MRGESISLRGLGVRFGAFETLRDFSLDIASGEFVCLLGPSGCGKSTVLNVVAGFVSATGAVEVAGRPVTGPDVSRGMVFQSSEALFPWLTVARNVAFGPRLRGVAKAEVEQVVAHYLQLVGLTPAAGKYPNELSGGMRQRVQIARVLANEPAVVLMDEPFGALDAQTREVMQGELVRIWEATRPTVVFVTHDVEEAVRLADRVVTMTAGPSAGLKDVFAVGLPRPRDPEDPPVLALQRRARESISEEVRRTMQAEVGATVA